MNHKLQKAATPLLLAALTIYAAAAQDIAFSNDTSAPDYVRSRPYVTREISVKFKSTDRTIAPLVLPSAGVLRTKSANSDIATLISAEMWNELFPNRYGVAKTGRNSAAETNSTDFFNYNAFVRACSFFPDFLHNADATTNKRELAAFLSHIFVETGGLRFAEQLNITQNYSVENKNYPPMQGKTYHGRGPIQLSYNYNYGFFSQSFFGDKNILLERPEMLLEDAVVSFASAIWFWMTPQAPKPSCHSVMAGTWQPSEDDKKNNRLPGFGLTFNIINAKNCGSTASDMAQKRYETYEYMCYFLKVDKGENCSCANQTPYGKELQK